MIGLSRLIPNHSVCTTIVNLVAFLRGSYLQMSIPTMSARLQLSILDAVAAIVTAETAGLRRDAKQRKNPHPLTVDSITTTIAANLQCCLVVQITETIATLDADRAVAQNLPPTPAKALIPRGQPAHG